MGEERDRRRAVRRELEVAREWGRDVDREDMQGRGAESEGEGAYRGRDRQGEEAYRGRDRQGNGNFRFLAGQFRSLAGQPSYARVGQTVAFLGWSNASRRRARVMWGGDPACVPVYGGQWKSREGRISRVTNAYLRGRLSWEIEPGAVD